MLYKAYLTLGRGCSVSYPYRGYVQLLESLHLAMPLSKASHNFFVVAASQGRRCYVCATHSHIPLF